MYIFPIVLAALDIGAAIVYAYNKDYARMMYWLSAASITISTLFIKG